VIVSLVPPGPPTFRLKVSSFSAMLSPAMVMKTVCVACCPGQ